MNRMYNNSMDALNLYSERIAQDMSRFTGGATLSPALRAKMREVALTEQLLKDTGIDVPKARRKRITGNTTRERVAERNLDAFLKSSGALKRRARARKVPSALQIRRGYIKSGVAACKSGIGNKDFNYLCNRIKPRKRKAAGLSGVGLSGLGYASGLSGLGYSRASGLSAAGLSAGRISTAKLAQMGRWSHYQDEINKLRNMGYAYRQAQQMAKHILRIN